MRVKVKEEALDLRMEQLLRLTTAALLALGLVLGSINCAWAQDKESSMLPNPQDKEKIIQTIEQYLEGGRKGDSKYMKEAFLPDAIIYGVRDGKAGGGPIQLLYDLVDGKPAAGDIPYEMTVLSVEQDIAIVRLDIPNWGGNHYTDMFAMVKDGDEWKIITKIYHTHQK